MGVEWFHQLETELKKESFVKVLFLDVSYVQYMDTDMHGLL